MFVALDFVSLARASGEVPFNVSRVIGHARSTIVDTIYAHTVGLKVTPPPVPPKPVPPSGPPKLRVIDGGPVRLPGKLAGR